MLHIVEDLGLFPYFCLGIASVSENWHLESPLARSCPGGGGGGAKKGRVCC